MNKELELFRMKIIATGFLFSAVLLFGYSHSQHNLGIWAWVGAFSEAAMVGALADWFAVVALFKQPMGLPIPHTAIIPDNKDKIADNLAEFVRDKFLDADSLVAMIRKHNPADKIAHWLKERKNTETIGNLAIKVISGALEFANDEQIRNVMSDAIHNLINKIDLSKSTGQILDTLTADNRHQELLNRGLEKLADLLLNPEVQRFISGEVSDWLRTEHAVIEKILPTERIGNFAGEKVVEMVGVFLRKVNEDSNHPLRKHFSEATSKLILSLKHDTNFLRKGDEIKEHILNDPSINNFVNGLWGDLKNWLQRDLENKHSVIRQKIIDSGQWMGEQLAASESLRDSINVHLEDAARKMAPDFSDFLTKHISSTVKSWNNEKMSRQIELSIGKDLQYIRLNGTLVGGIVGLLIHGTSGLIN